MVRLKDTKAKITSTRPITSSLTPTERIKLLANLVIDRIIEDQNNGKLIFKRISEDT